MTPPRAPAHAPASESVHNRLVVLRAERGLSRQDLADALGVHYQTIGYLERGEYNPTLALALRISAFFELPVEAIFSLQPFTPMSAALYAGRDEPGGPR
jgi:DNA-binding XRE family transcriptional regulator